MTIEMVTLKDTELLESVKAIVKGRLPTLFVEAVFTHMKNNKEDEYDHKYLKDSLFVANLLMRRAAEFDEHERKVVFALVMLLEIGHPITSVYPYDAAPGVAWYFLRTYADGVFSTDDERFITQNCRPQRTSSLRLNTFIKMQLVASNTKKLTDIVGQNYEKVYNEFVRNHNRLATGKKLDELFWSIYGPTGNLWGGISDAAKGIFASEISLFKKNLNSTLTLQID